MDKLEESLSNTRKITDVGLKRDAMRENLIAMNMTFQVFKNDPDQFKNYGKQSTPIVSIDLGNVGSSLNYYGVVILIFVTLGTLSNISVDYVEKNNTCQRI